MTSKLPTAVSAYNRSSIKAERRITWWDRVQVFWEEMRVRVERGQQRGSAQRQKTPDFPVEPPSGLGLR